MSPTPLVVPPPVQNAHPHAVSPSPPGRNAIDGARHVKPVSLSLDRWTSAYCRTLGKGQISAGCRLAVRIAATCLTRHPQALFLTETFPGARRATSLLDPEMIRAGMRAAPTVSKADVEAIFLAMVRHHVQIPPESA